MNLVKKIYTKNILAALDYGAETVVVLIAEKKQDGSFRILGAGDAKAQGIEQGEIAHLGDVTESITEALKKAEVSSGTKVLKLYFNFDDCHTQSVFSSGFALLDGEGEICASDVEAAKKVAERLAGAFEKHTLYSQEIQFTIDLHDEVASPIGIFGKRLDVVAHILRARAGYFDLWRRIMQRAQVARYTPVLSAWSTAYGLLPKGDRIKKRLILDLGKDFLNIFLFANNRIVRYQIASRQNKSGMILNDQAIGLIKEFLVLDAALKEVLITGDLAQDPLIFGMLESQIQIPMRIAAPLGVPKLHYPQYASLVGLLSVADEIESKIPILRAERGVFSNVKQQAETFINEYF
ncbi:MAG: hypothetical protein AUJ72_04650 [Candidatus Omnitrophica bacterium CG1_02_46_14]|nr:MAG: hypothetical protein AUJ72_04650 [Candidatus Omnitrophica bacterium CG1_02_46_14]